MGDSIYGMDHSHLSEKEKIECVNANIKEWDIEDSNLGSAHYLNSYVIDNLLTQEDQDKYDLVLFDYFLDCGTYVEDVIAQLKEHCE